MKKITSILICLFFIFGLASCSSLKTVNPVKPTIKGTSKDGYSHIPVNIPKDTKKLTISGFCDDDDELEIKIVDTKAKDLKSNNLDYMENPTTIKKANILKEYTFKNGESTEVFEVPNNINVVSIVFKSKKDSKTNWIGYKLEK